MSDALPAPQPERRSRVRTVLRYAVVALVLLVAVLFFARRDIGNRLANKLNDRLSRAGAFVSWQSADWIPGPGIRFHGLALYRDAAKQDRLAFLGNMTVVKGEPEWNRWDTLTVSIADARLTLGSGEDETNLEDLNMEISIQRGSAELQECRAHLNGLRIEAKGTHVQTAATAKAPAATEPASRGKGLFHDVNLDALKFVKEWAKFKPETDEPVLKLEFHPLPEGAGVGYAARLEGKMFEWRGQKWDFVEAALKTSVGENKSLVQIGEMRLGQAGRTAEIEGEFDSASRVLRIGRLESGIGLLAILRPLMPGASASLASFTSTGDWRISGEGEIPLDHPENFRWGGAVELSGDLAYGGSEVRVAVQNPGCSFRVQGDEWSLSSLKAGLWGGSLSVPTFRVHLPPGKAKRRFDVQIVLQQAQLESALGCFGPPIKQPGSIQFDWKGGGEFDPASFAGVGTLSIQDAGLFSVPEQDRLALHGSVALVKGVAESNRFNMVSVSMADAHLTLGSGADAANLEHLNMKLQIQPGSAELQEFQARLQGLRIEAKGTHVKTAAVADTKVDAALARVAAAKVGTATEPASRGKGLFHDVNLDALKSVREWVKFKPETDEPVMKLEFHPLPEGGGVDYAATLEGRRFSWQGQKWDFVQAAMKTSAGKRKSPIQTGEIRLGLAGQTVEIEGEFDPLSRVLRVGRLESGIDLVTLVRALVPGAEASMGAITSTGASLISGTGEIPLDRPENSQWHGRVELRGDLIYASKPVRVAVQSPTCSVRVKGDEWSFTSLKARLWDGDLDVPMLQFHLPSRKQKARFDMQLALQQAQLESVIRSFGPPQKQPGTVQFDWKGGGAFDLASFAGVGTLSIQDAEFGRVPLVGGLSRVLDKLTPGFGRDSSTRGTVTHRTSGGTMHLENLNLDCQQTRIDLAGTIDLRRQYADMTGELRVKAILGLITSPLSAKSEVKGEGPLGEVKWDTHKKLGTGLIGGTLKAIGKDDDDTAKSADRAAKEPPKK